MHASSTTSPCLFQHLAKNSTYQKKKTHHTSPLEGKYAQQLVHIHLGTESMEPKQVKIMTKIATRLCMTLFHLGNL
jgi:hypothetical protein